MGGPFRRDTGTDSAGHLPLLPGGGRSDRGVRHPTDLFYEINANIGCRWTEKIGTAIGYRMYDADYEDDGFSYDVKQDGWQVGLTWDFQTSSRG